MLIICNVQMLNHHSRQMMQWSQRVQVYQCFLTVLKVSKSFKVNRLRGVLNLISGKRFLL